MASAPLRVGYVPEHFSAPLLILVKEKNYGAELVPFPSGTGHMVTAIRAGEIDVAIGLTEGWIAGLGKEGVEGDGGYRIVGSYVNSPLRWAISTGANRDEILKAENLKDRKVGVSRFGSGSHIMSYVLAKQKGYLNPENPQPYSDIVVLNNFLNLRNAVNSGEADFFMWEFFTSKKFYDSKEIAYAGEIPTPWPSWMIVASTKTAQGGKDQRVADLLRELQSSVTAFSQNRDVAIDFITNNLEYSKEDAEKWFEEVEFSAVLNTVSVDTVQKVIDILVQAGIMAEGKGMKPEEMVFQTS